MLRKIRNIVLYGKANLVGNELLLLKSFKNFKKTNTLFIHIPKAAGISFHYGLYGMESYGHASIKDYIDYFGESTINSIFTFTIARNPYDRLYSAYNYLIKGGRNNETDLKYQNIIREYDTFEDFVLRFFRDKTYLDLHHFVPQTNWLTNERGELVIDFIGHFEDLENDFLKVSKKIDGGPFLKELPKKNITKKSSTKKDGDVKYTPEMYTVVNYIYANDFKLLNYSLIVQE